MANEKRLIDANALADEVDNSKYNNPHTNGRVRINHFTEHDHFLRMILDAPTVDAVEVVRCKDCRRCGVYTSGKLYCKHQDGLTDPKPDDFCSYGERRTE